ncbi:MAG TPA: hypothetical protein VJA94_11895 [Candidatus Angelobacter sp.]
MPWMPVINDNDKAASLAIGVVVVGGMAGMFVVGVPWIRAFLYSFPVAFLVALGIRYWHNRHKVDIITLRSAAESTDKSISTRSR